MGTFYLVSGWKRTAGCAFLYLLQVNERKSKTKQGELWMRGGGGGVLYYLSFLGIRQEGAPGLSDG